jgi:transcriptional regulator NrdR family protein
MRGLMSDMANAIDNMYDSAAEELHSPAAAERDAAVAKTEDVLSEFNNEFYTERLLTALRNAQIGLESLKAMPESIKSATIQTKINEYNNNIAANIAHFCAVVEKLQTAGIDFKPAIDPANFSALSAREAAGAQAEELAKLNTAIQEKLAHDTEPLKAALKTRAEAMLSKINAALANANAIQAEAAALRKKFNKARKEFDSANGPYCFADTTTTYAKDRAAQLTSQQNEITQTAAGIDSKNSPSELKAIMQVLQMHCRQNLTTGAICEATSWAGGFGTQRFTNAGCKHNNERSDMPALPADAWHAKAIEDFLNTVGAESPEDEGSLLPHAIKEANKDLFDSLMQEFTDSDGCLSIPGSTRNMDAEKLDKLARAAESMGMSVKDLLSMLQSLANDMSNNRASAMAKEIGELIRDELTPAAKVASPIDDALFGEAVEKKTTVLDGAAITQINDEAKNAAEEEYVAYLSHSEAKPTVKVKKAKKAEIASGQAMVKRVIAQHRGAVSKIREALQFQDTKRIGEVHGMRSGDLDEGSLHKLRYDSEHIWSQKTVSKLPDVAVGILVDQSGSMGSGRKIDQAREMCIILSEAVRKIAGVHLHIFGHTANQASTTDLTLFEHYSSTDSAENADLGALGNIRSYSNNYDGYAIKETAKLLSVDPAKRKYLFVIADGLPHGQGYSGDDAEKHVASVCSFVRTRLKIPTYAFAVGVPLSERGSFETQYGKNNVLFLSQVSQCLPQITRFLRNALQREKTLVSVSAD